MRAFIIGATGYLGSHVAANLRDAGHDVTGLSRSDDGDALLRGLGIEVVRGDVDDRAGLIDQARAADCTVFAARVIERTWDDEGVLVAGVLAGIEGLDKTVLFTSGTGVLSQPTNGDYGDSVFAEADSFVSQPVMAPRVRTENLVRGAVDRGIRGIVIRPPGIWGGGILPAHARMMMTTVHAIGAVCYIGRGLNSYTNVHVEDLAEVYRLAWERGTAGSLYHATSGEVANRWVAEMISRAIDVPTKSITIEEGARYWGEYGARIVMGASSRTMSPRTRRELGWVPTRLDIDDELRVVATAAYADPMLVKRQKRPGEMTIESR